MLWGGKLVRNKNLSTIHNFSDTLLESSQAFALNELAIGNLSREALFRGLVSSVVRAI